ncbi:hypothetical protein HPB52_014408 [Rhipicephalus sanguineus]|uniref:Reverse transcriptase domain-containing protein n=1 Tax=Rhipicephalus sanguineus TaxID=34632 RepID=A0A9D4PCH4_RHISA|nr:hypothetical protein HPB52_014408 [Rhipicephalus sanguineus]
MERALLESSLGFRLKYSTSGIDENRRLPGLAFADDVVLMAESKAELQALLDICATEMTSLGLRFNAKKTKVVPFAGNMAESVDLKLGSESIALETTYKYLGVLLCSEASIYNQQEAHIRQASLRAQCILRRRILWGCNRFIMVRDIWKLVHVPCLTFANAVCMTAATREWLERRQREVGRTALACHGRVADESVQGDLGWSCFEARKASSKLVYRGRLQFMCRERWARQVFEYLAATCIRTSWVNRVYRLEKKYTSGAPGVRDKEEELWQQAMSGKVTLELYRSSKGTIGSVRMYDNSTGSSLLLEARAGALQTLTYKRTIDREMASVLCRACGSADETIAHLVIECGQIGLPRTESLRTALGFAGEDGETDVQAARVSMRRLERWRAVVVAQRSRTQGGAV